MAEVTMVCSEKNYIVSGSEIINLQERVGNAMADVSWMRQFVRDSLEMVSNDEKSFPKFVARIGMLLANIDETRIQFRNLKLKDLALGMKIKEAPDSMEVNNGHSGD